MSDITHTVLALCLGNHPLKGGAMGTYFTILDEDGETQTEQTLAYKKVSGTRAGGVYRLQLTDALSISGDPEYIEPYRDEDERIAIMAADNAREIARRAKAKQVQDTYLTPMILERMRPLRTAYKKLDYHSRRALELAVLEWLRR